MALAAQRTRIQRFGDAVVGEQTQLVYDEESGLVGQKKITVAQVPTEGGGTAVLIAEQVEVGQVHAPRYTPRRALGALTYPVNHAQDSPEEKTNSYAACCWLVCGCCICLVSLAMIIPIAAVGLVSCSALFGAAVTGLILGVVTFLMSLLCCCHFCATENVIIRCFCCSIVSILLLIFIGALISNTVFVAEKIDIIYSTDNSTACYGNSPVVSVAVMGMSYVMLLLFGLFCLCSCLLCLGSKMGEE